LRLKEGKKLTIYKTVANNIKKIRKEQGMSQEKLAEKAGIHVTYISRIERHKQAPSLDVVEKIGKALNIEIYKLFQVPPKENKKIIEEINNDILLKLDEPNLEYIKKLLVDYQQHIENG
jgi:transcriptional regulator with XRE-family HTH domain